MKKNMTGIILTLIISIIIFSTAAAEGVYRYCPYCGKSFENGYNEYSCQENECSYGNNDYDKCYNEKDYYSVCLFSFITIAIIFTVATIILILTLK